MKQLFPKEIIKQTTEAHFAKHNQTSRIIYLTILLSFLIALGLLPFIFIDITTQSRGVIRSGHERNMLLPAISGRVIYSTLEENKSVMHGDTLLVLDAGRLEHEISLTRQLNKQKLEYIDDLNRILAGNTTGLKTQMYQKEQINYAEKMDQYKLKINNTHRQYSTALRLFEKDVISRYEFDVKKYDYDLILNQQRSFIKQQKREWQNQLEKEIESQRQLTSQLEKLAEEKKSYIITAPVSGIITEYRGVKKNNFITAGQQLAAISPKDNLIIECYVAPADIGLIKKDMHVRFQFDAFNYNQWGMGTGNVVDISHDMTQQNNTAFFRVRCSIDQQFLALKNGHEGKLSNGMPLTGRFLITRRNLFQLLYDKMDNWLNPKNTPPKSIR